MACIFLPLIFLPLFFLPDLTSANRRRRFFVGEQEINCYTSRGQK